MRQHEGAQEKRGMHVHLEWRWEAVFYEEVLNGLGPQQNFDEGLDHLLLERAVARPLQPLLPVLCAEQVLGYWLVFCANKSRQDMTLC